MMYQKNKFSDLRKNIFPSTFDHAQGKNGIDMLTKKSTHVDQNLDSDRT